MNLTDGKTNHPQTGPVAISSGFSELFRSSTGRSHSTMDIVMRVIKSSASDFFPGDVSCGQHIFLKSRGHF